MINELEKDKKALAKDVASLAAEIAIKRKELDGLVDAVRVTTETLEKEKARLAPYLAYADAELERKRIRNKQLDIDLEHMKKLKEIDFSAIDNKILQKRNELTSIEANIKSRNQSLKNLLSEESQSNKRVESLKREVDTLDAAAVKNAGIVNRLTELGKQLMVQVESLHKDEAEATSHINEILNRQEELDKFHESLKKKELLLKNREDEFNDTAAKAMFMFEKSAELINLPFNGFRK